jgi:hypothetical protein
MSEHQYYEFVAVDRPLDRNEMVELRSCSSRATITATSFINEYDWGDLNADPAEWMRRYFDAFVYTANWRSCRLALRLPHDAFKNAELTRFATACALTDDDSGTHWIIDWYLDEGLDDDRFCMETGEGWMGRLMPLRDELLRGDLRPLYLGWLAGVSAGEIGEDALEPDVPLGMSKLSAAQHALVEFLEIDSDLMAAAAVASAARRAQARRKTAHCDRTAGACRGSGTAPSGTRSERANQTGIRTPQAARKLPSGSVCRFWLPLECSRPACRKGHGIG